MQSCALNQGALNQENCEYKGQHRGLRYTLRAAVGETLHLDDQKVDFAIVIKLLFCYTINALFDTCWLFATQKMVFSYDN